MNDPAFYRRLAVGLLLFTVLLSPACSYLRPRVWVEDEQTLSLDGAGVARLSCETHNGAIHTRAAATPTPTYEVVVSRRAGGQTEEDARACLEAIEVTHGVSGDQLELGWQWATSRRSGWGAEVSFEIEQPAATALAATTHNGSIRAVGLRGGVDVGTHNGPIELDDCRGPTRASTHNGPVRGSVECREIHVDTHNGGVDLALGGEGPVAGSVQTHNGGVVLRVGDGVSTRLVCSTNNGDVRVQRQLNDVVHKSNVLVADLGEGGGTLDVETHNGAIIVH